MSKCHFVTVWGYAQDFVNLGCDPCRKMVSNAKGQGSYFVKTQIPQTKQFPYGLCGFTKLVLKFPHKLLLPNPTTNTHTNQNILNEVL